MSGRLRVKNWAKFQHYKSYKGTPPPWIKLHERLLDDHEFNALPEAKRWQLVAIWLLASKSNGEIPDDPAFVARRTGSKRVDLGAFVEQGVARKGRSGADRGRTVREHVSRRRREDERRRKRKETRGEEEGAARVLQLWRRSVM